MNDPVSNEHAENCQKLIANLLTAFTTFSVAKLALETTHLHNSQAKNFIFVLAPLLQLQDFLQLFESHNKLSIYFSKANKKAISKLKYYLVVW